MQPLFVYLVCIISLITKTQGLNYLQQAHQRHNNNKTKTDYRHGKNLHFHHGVRAIDPHATAVISGDPLEGLTWKDLRSVNGFKNNNVAFLLISTTATSAFEAELWRLHKDIQKLREDEESYFARERACNITNWNVMVLTTTLVEKAKSGLSELEEDWKKQSKRY